MLIMEYPDLLFSASLAVTFPDWRNRRLLLMRWDTFGRQMRMRMGFFRR